MGRPQYKDNARFPDQIRKMEEAEGLGECPFCLLGKYHDAPVIKEGDHWVVTANDNPYKHTRIHMLLILKKHGENLEDIPSEAGAELIRLSKWLKLEFAAEGGALCMRFGNEQLSGGTVPHVHAHFIVPDLTSADYKPVRFKIGSKI